MLSRYYWFYPRACHCGTGVLVLHAPGKWLPVVRGADSGSLDRLLEGALQAAAVAALLFGVGAVILLVIVRRLTSLSTGTSSSPSSSSAAN